MKLRSFFAILLSICLLSTVSSCKEASIPHDVMDKSTMVEFLCEAYLLEGFYAVETGYHYELMKPEIAQSYQDLFDKYHLSQEDFDRSMHYYSRHPKVYDEIHAEVVRRLDENIDAAAPALGVETPESSQDSNSSPRRKSFPLHINH